MDGTNKGHLVVGGPVHVHGCRRRNDELVTIEAIAEESPQEWTAT
jgi:hypothetical protein